MTTSPLDALFGAEGGGDFLSEGGTYTLEVVKAEAKNSGSGKPQLKLNLKVVGGPEEGKTIMHYLTYSPESEAALNILKRSLEALGIDDTFAKEVAANMPEGSQVITLFLEAAKVLPGRRVIADTAKDANNVREEYRDRVKVNFSFKPVQGASVQFIPTVITAPGPTGSDQNQTSAVPPADAPPF